MTPTPHLLHLADQAATPATYPLHHGVLLSVDDVITQATLKQHLGQLSGALAVDMEAHSIARIATQQQLPFVSLKTVFDACDDDLPASITQCAAPDGALHPARLIYTLLRHPAQFTYLPRWRRKAKTAGQHLGNWLYRFLTLLIPPGE
jgi:nucleoside phosphorylase